MGMGIISQTLFDRIYSHIKWYKLYYIKPVTKGQFVEIRTVVIQSGTFVVPKVTEIVLKIYFEIAGHTDFLYVIGRSRGGLPLSVRIKCVNYDVYLRFPVF